MEESGKEADTSTFSGVLVLLENPPEALNDEHIEACDSPGWICKEIGPKSSGSA